MSAAQLGRFATEKCIFIHFSGARVAVSSR